MTERGQGEGIKYSGQGKSVREVFNDKWGLVLKQNGWGGGGKKFPKNWFEHEQTYKELMYINTQNLHLLQGRSGGTMEPVRVDDDRVENKNQDDGAGPDT